MPVEIIENKLRLLSDAYLVMVNEYIEKLLEQEKSENKLSAKGIAAKYSNKALIKEESQAKEEAFSRKV